MMTVLQIDVACLLTATLLTVAMVVSACQLGRLATRDAARRRAMIVASLALIVALGGVPPLHAETAEECRSQCSFDLEACKNGCLNSHFFDGCLDDCHSDEEDCLSGCR